MKKLPFKTIALVSLLSFASLADATTGGGKTKPPEDSSSEDRTAPTPTPSTTPSFWDWIKQYLNV